MKLAFSTALVPSPTFFTLCNTAAEYGYEGMELHVAVAKTFSRGRLIVDGAQDFAVPGEGKLLKRGLPVSAIRCKI